MSVISRLSQHMPVLLVVLGLALFISSAWVAFGLAAGLLVAGIACFALQWYLLDGSNRR